MSAWQTIDTAPRDGREVIACRSIGNAYDLEFVRWNDACGEWLDRTGDPFDNPTHWQSRPEPPEDRT